MKKQWLAILAGIVVVAQVGFAQVPAQSVTVGTTSTMILPPAKPITTNQWAAATAYVRGDQIVSSNGVPYFWCVVAGTSTNTIPTFSTTNDVTDGPTCQWRYIQPVRNAFTIQYHGTSVMFLGMGWNAVTNKGIGLYGGSAWSEGFGGGKGAYQGAIYGQTVTGSANVSVQEQ